MFREITRLRDVQDAKHGESLNQADRMKALEFDLQKTLLRIDETNKVVESRSYDIRQKSVQLEDTEKEIARVKDLNAQQNVEIVALRRDVDRVSADCYDLRKNIEGTESRNADLGSNIRSQDIQCKEKEDNLYGIKKDIENMSYTNGNMRGDLNDYMQEKEALERHSRILLGQNDDLTKELERFVNTDEVLRQQLDRRGRVLTMQDRNYQEIGHSEAKVYHARERSPGKKYTASSPLRASGNTNQHQSTAAYSYGRTYGASATAKENQAQSRSPPRDMNQSYARRSGNSPLRSSYKATYNY